MKKYSLVLIFIFSLAIVTPVLAEIGSVNTGEAVTLVNPIGTSNPNVVVGRIIQAVLGIVGSLALLMFVYGGLTWMMAAGNKENVSKGKDILVWATIGLAVIFTSYAFVKFILQGLGVGAK